MSSAASSATVPTVRPVSSTVPTVEDIEEIMTTAEDDDGDVNAIRKVSSVVVVVRPKTTYSLAEDDGIGANVANVMLPKNVAAAAAKSPENIPDNCDDVVESPENVPNSGDDVASYSDDASPPCRGGEQLFDVYPEVAACRERFDKFRQLIEADLEAKLGRLQDYRRHGSAAGGHSLRDRNYANIQIFMLNKYAWRLRRFRVICDGELTHLEATFRAGVNEDDVRREADHYTRLGTVRYGTGTLFI